MLSPPAPREQGPAPRDRPRRHPRRRGAGGHRLPHRAVVGARGFLGVDIFFVLSGYPDHDPAARRVAANRARSASAGSGRAGRVASSRRCSSCSSGSGATPLFFAGDADVRAMRQRRAGDARLRGELAVHLRQGRATSTPSPTLTAAPHVVARDRGAVLPRLAGHRARAAAVVPLAAGAAGRRRGGKRRIDDRHVAALSSRPRSIAAPTTAPTARPHDPDRRDRRGAPPGPGACGASVAITSLEGAGVIGALFLVWACVTVDGQRVPLPRGLRALAVATAAVIARSWRPPPTPAGPHPVSAPSGLRGPDLLRPLSVALADRVGPHERATGLTGISLLGVRVFATFAIAYLSWSLVEMPIRRGARRARLPECSSPWPPCSRSSCSS